MNLHHDHEAFSELIIAASNELHIPPGIIEKDYYVTLALRELASRVKGMVFKGGTSLTKCYQILERFSEDIDISYAKEPLVHLINLDTLLAAARENQNERERLVKESSKLMEERLQETLLWLHQSHMDATIESLQQRCNAIVEDGYAYLNRKMDLGKREQKLLKKVLHASLQRLLREPILELKQLESEEEQEEYKRLVRQLFQI